MHFLFPEAWYLLPLVVVPFLINLQRYLNRKTVLIPSLFFLDKILKKKRLRQQNRLWELLVEFLFLIGLIFLLSRPIFSEPNLGQERLLVLLDDSPSMRYYFIPTRNLFFTKLKKQLEEKKYEQIDMVFLSQLGKKEPFSFRYPSEIDNFYKIIPVYLQKNWSIEKVKKFFYNSEEQQRYQDYSFIVYSDNKENHFRSFQSSDSSHLTFPPLLNVANLPPSPALKKISLKQKNFFSKEHLNIKIQVNSQQEKDLFLVIHLNQEMVFRKQIIPPSESENKKESVLKKNNHETSFTVKFPVTVKSISKGKRKTLEKNRPSQISSRQKLTIALEKSGVVFQEITKVINVYSPKTISLIPPQHSSTSFFKTLFAYDLEKGNLAISPNPNTADTLLVLDPGHISPMISPNWKILFFLNPQENTIIVNQILKKWGVNDFTVDRKKTVGVLDKLEFPFLEKTKATSASEYNIKNYFIFDFNSSPSSLVPEFNLVTIQKQPIIFRSGNFAVFNGISIEEMTSKVNPQHLIWIYEILFSFWGKKPIRFTDINPSVLSKQEMRSYSKIISNTSYKNILHNQSSIFEKSLHQGKEDNPSATTIFSPSLKEFASTKTKNGWEKVFPEVVEFTTSKDEMGLPALATSITTNNFIIDGSSQSSKKKSKGLFSIFWSWISIIAMLEILLLGLLAYWFIARIRKTIVYDRYNSKLP